MAPALELVGGDRRAVAGRQIVVHPGFVTARQQQTHRVAANVTGSADDKYFHAPEE